VKENKMRIGWVGFHIEGIPALKCLLEQGVRIEAVFTLKPELAARRSGAGDYRTLCERFNVQLYEISNINEPSAVALLRALELDLVFVLGWTQILKPETIQTAKIGMIGAHASLLPHNRGRAPVNWALIHGETLTGNSLIWLAEHVDSGDVIDQTPIKISSYDTCASIYEQVAISNKEMILRALPKLAAGEAIGRSQGRLDEPLLPGRQPKDGLINWGEDSAAIYNFVRALTRPYPGAFSWLDGQRWLIWQAALLPNNVISHARPGETLGPVFSPIESACGQMVACGKGALVLLELEKENGERLSGRGLSEQAWRGKAWQNE
jgi:methionyl-tRNA formyltransferase